MKWALLISRLLLGIVFAFAALSKMNSYRDFVLLIRSTVGLGWDTGSAIAIAIIVLELAIASSFLTRRFLFANALVALSLLLVFSIFKLYLAMHDFSVICECFGKYSSIAEGGRGFLLNLTLMLLTAWVLVHARREQRG